MRYMFRAAAATAMLALAQVAGAAVFFNDTFNSYSAPFYGNQADTGLIVGAVGNLDGWISGGLNAVHAVDRSGTGDWAPMFYGYQGGGAAGTNAMLMADGVAANLLGTNYNVSFEGAAAVWANASQASGVGDYLRFNVIDENFETIASYLYDPADWSGTPSNPFTMANFTYAGTGSGNVRLYIYAETSFDKFGGAIDNLTISSIDGIDEGPTDAPEPAALALLGFGLAGVAAARRKRG